MNESTSYFDTHRMIFYLVHIMRYSSTWQKTHSKKYSALSFRSKNALKVALLAKSKN